MTLANFDIGNVFSNMFDLKIVVVKIPIEDFCSEQYLVDVVALCDHEALGLRCPLKTSNHCRFVKEGECGSDSGDC